MTEEQTVLARGFAALLKITKIEPEKLYIAGPYAWTPWDPEDDRVCWEIHGGDQLRVVQPEESREDAERWIADLKAAALLLERGEHG